MALPPTEEKIPGYVEVSDDSKGPLPQVDYAVHPEALEADANPPRTELAPQKRCRLGARWFVCMAFAVVAVVIAAVVGGVLGSRGHHFPGDGLPPPPANSTDTPPLPPPSLGLAPGIAAAVNVIDNSPQIQDFYQDNSSAVIRYRVSANQGQYGPESNINVPFPASLIGPITLSSSIESNAENSLLNLFYILKTANRTDIAWTLLECTSGTTQCSQSSSKIIQVGDLVHPRSTLAAVWLGGLFTTRLYYQSVSGAIIELNGDRANSTGWEGKVVQATSAAAGSGIAAAAAPGPIIHVFYASSAGGYPTAAVFNYNKNGWQNLQNIDSSVPPGWSPTATLSACYESAADTYRFYYIAPSTGQINEYSRVGVNSPWSRSPGPAATWLSADAGIAAVAWTDQVRLLYMTKGKLQESSLSNQTWMATKDLP